MDPAQLRDAIGEGLRTLARMGVPDPIAMRTGNLRADRGVYRAMSEFGLPVASNVGVALNRPAASDLHLFGGRTASKAFWRCRSSPMPN
jgi:hypothetical protein